MIAETPRTPEQIRANWARVKRQTPRPRPEPVPRPLNLQPTLDLGNLVFFTFRGRAYGIPPLAWRTGEKMLDIYLQLMELSDPDKPLLTREQLPAYFGSFRQLQSLLWNHCHAVGWLRRLGKRLRIVRNPFREATEAEILGLALFTLGRRMTHHDPAPAPDPNGNGTS